jgi:hypothetical protein
MDVKRWQDVKAKITGLWPRYEPTDAERDLIASRLVNLNQKWLDQAVDEYRCENSSTVFRLAELLEVYRRIANAGENRMVKVVETPTEQRARWAREVADDARGCRQYLAKQGREELVEAIAWLRKNGWLKHGQLPGRVSEWDDGTVLKVAARVMDQQEGARA